MKFEQKDPAREFVVGNDMKVTIRDCGNIRLEADEQVTFLADGAEYDLVRKEWGFYATPSLDGRLARFGLRAVLIRNTRTGRYFILLVQRGREPQFQEYLRVEFLEVVVWLDSSVALDELRAKMQAPS